MRAASLLAVLAVLGAAAPAPASVRHGRRIRVLVTSYCLRGHTATGTLVHPGTVAVDPSLIRLGSRLYVPRYGSGRAEDTGGMIRGAHIDTWMSSCAAAMRSTRHEVITVW